MNVERSPVSDFSYYRGKPRGGGILVLDAGTSTIDFTLFAVGSDNALARTVDGGLDRLYADARFHAEDATGRTITDLDCADENPPGHCIAVEFLFNWLEQRAGAVPVLAVGHHVLHGGARFSGPAPIDAPTLQYLQALVPLAPARQSRCLLPIQVIAEGWPELPQVACFETAFHRDVPAVEQPSRSRGRSAGEASVATATTALRSSASSRPCRRSTRARPKGKPSRAPR